MQPRSWNEVSNKSVNVLYEDHKPTLKAIILDFSSVSRIDLTSTQNLIDARSVLDRYAAPHSVQWHFACIHSRWIKRALVSAKFGFPTFEDEESMPKKWASFFSTANAALVDDKFVISDGPTGTTKSLATKTDIEMLEVKDDTSKGDVILEQHEELSRKNSPNGPALFGVNRPYFHVDVDAAVKSAMLFEELKEAVLEESRPGI